MSILALRSASTKDALILPQRTNALLTNNRAYALARGRLGKYMFDGASGEPFSGMKYTSIRIFRGVPRSQSQLRFSCVVETAGDVGWHWD